MPATSGSLFRLCIKAGAGEGYPDELLGIKTEIHFSSFSEAEIADFLPRAGFALSFLKRRSPYDCEHQAYGLCAIGSKAS
jgi:hypothetical protein